jgi:uncharacterized protein (DUF433 family)
MTLLIAAEPVPLITDEYGVVRVKNSRVTLDSVIAAFNKNESIEEVAEAYLRSTRLIFIL